MGEVTSQLKNAFIHNDIFGRPTTEYIKRKIHGIEFYAERT